MCQTLLLVSQLVHDETFMCQTLLLVSQLVHDETFMCQTLLLVSQLVHDETFRCLTSTFIDHFHCQSKFVDTDSEIKGKMSKFSIKVYFIL
jgi:hypothetical protein